MTARSALLVFALLLSLFGLSSVASATTMRGLTIDDLVAQADLVVRGRVEAVSDVMTSVDGTLVSRSVTTIAIDETLAGTATSDTIRVVEPGTRDRTLLFVRIGMTELRRGQEVLLFLRRRGDAFVPVGHAQGAFIVGRDRRSGAASVRRAGDPGVLLGPTEAHGIDLERRASLDAVVDAVRLRRGAPR